MGQNVKFELYYEEKTIDKMAHLEKIIKNKRAIDNNNERK